MKRVALVLVLLAGCRDKKSGSPPPPPVMTAEPVKSVATFDAAAVTSLLKLPARVAVSSLVDNPKANPNHLIDGTTKTAWNGKTGDLHAWIAVRVPADDRVTAFKIATTNVAFKPFLSTAPAVTTRSRSPTRSRARSPNGRRS